MKESKEPKVEGIEANRIAATKKMEENAKKDKVTPPSTDAKAAPESKADVAAAEAALDVKEEKK